MGRKKKNKRADPLLCNHESLSRTWEDLSSETPEAASDKVIELLSWEVLSHQTPQFNSQEMGNILAWHLLVQSTSSREGWTSKGSGDQFSLWKSFKTWKLLWSISDLELGKVVPSYDLLHELNSTLQITWEFTLTSNKNDSMITTLKYVLAFKLFTLTSASYIHCS